MRPGRFAIKSFSFFICKDLINFDFKHTTLKLGTLKKKIKKIWGKTRRPKQYSHKKIKTKMTFQQVTTNTDDRTAQKSRVDQESTKIHF